MLDSSAVIEFNMGMEISHLLGIIRIICSQLATIRASAIICVSEELRGRLWLRYKPVNVIIDGTDLSLFSPIDKLDARRQLKWPSNEPVIFL